MNKRKKRCLTCIQAEEPTELAKKILKKYNYNLKELKKNERKYLTHYPSSPVLQDPSQRNCRKPTKLKKDLKKKD